MQLLPLNKKTIYISHRLDIDSYYNKSSNIELGKSGYSYYFVMEAFMKFFDKYKLNYKILKMPEIYKTDIALEKLNKNRVHISFNEIKSIRYLKNSYNIVVFAWEFDKINVNYKENLNPLSNHYIMLQEADEIWTLSSHTKNILNNYGFDNVYWIPSPIDIKYNKTSNYLDMDHFMDGKEIVFLSNIKKYDSEMVDFMYDLNDKSRIAYPKAKSYSKLEKEFKNKKIYTIILNPWDERKNFVKLIEVFNTFTTKYSNVVLLVKLNIDNVDTKLININQILKLRFNINIDNNRIKFFSDYMIKEDIYEFLKFSDFYISISRAEGQNLPLLEAMSMGIIPIATNNTAMNDYINKSNSIVVKSNNVKVPIEIAKNITPDITWYDVRDNDFLVSLEKSYNLSKEDYYSMSQMCIETVDKIYSDKKIYEKVVERIFSEES